MRHLQFAVQDYWPANSNEEGIALAQSEVAAILFETVESGCPAIALSRFGCDGHGTPFGIPLGPQ